MHRFAYHEPTSIEETLDLLVQHAGNASLLAGGTALLVDMGRGERQPAHLVSLWSVPGLKAIALNGGLRLGALATMTELAAGVANQPIYAGLRESALQLGARQVQNMATIGGNICYASPGADLVPPLLCLDAELHLTGPTGTRSVLLDGFHTGPDQTALKPAEVLTQITVPSPPSRTGTAFIKIMRRRAVDCSIVSVAARVTLAEDSTTCSEVRVGLAAVAPTPIRARQAEALLTGEPADPELVKRAAQRAREESKPITDVRASADYRRMMVETLVERAILTAVERARSA